MSTLRDRAHLLLFAGIFTMILSGCAAVIGVGAGAGTVAYIRGELKATKDVGIDRIWGASRQAMRDLEFPINNTKKDASSAVLESETADERSITIRLKRVSERTTQIGIRVGWFGDEELSRLILDKIEQNL